MGFFRRIIIYYIVLSTIYSFSIYVLGVDALMKSIIQTNKENCFICGRRANEEHHCIYGTANRKLSEKYGLKVYLCTDCHRTGKYAVHRCHEIDLKLKKIAQRKFEKEYPKLSFLQIFGKNYL